MMTDNEPPPTCGRGLAANAVVPARMADFLAVLAANLEAHLPTIDRGDIHGEAEYDAYVQLVHAHREISTQLQAAAALMAAHHDLPMARHLPEALEDPGLVEIFRSYVTVEEDLVELLSESVERDREMLRLFDGERPGDEPDESEAEMRNESGFAYEPRISLVTLAVRDLPRVASFYEKLGWRRSGTGGDEVAFFQLGGIILAVWSRDELATDAAVPADGDGFRSFSLAYNVRTAAEVDAALVAAASAGGTVTQPAREASWGGRTGYFADPDGNLWEVAWNPGFTLDEGGGVHLPPDPPA